MSLCFLPSLPLSTPRPPHTPYHTQNPIHCATTILKEEGLRGMWSGAAPTMLRNGTNQMCLFWAKHNMDRCAGQQLACVLWCAVLCCVT